MEEKENIKNKRDYEIDWRKGIQKVWTKKSGRRKSKNNWIKWRQCLERQIVMKLKCAKIDELNTHTKIMESWDPK